MDFDPRMTFDSFVVGPANRLASAAARRAAESPGKSYNPLFLYSASGLGKSHILSAIAQLAQRVESERQIVYQTLEGYLDDLTRALERGSQEEARGRYRSVDVLLLDDVQFLTGQAEAQEMLLRTLDALTSQGSQVVLASDRPPAEINGLDARLLSRFSGGLIVDIGQPDYETRVAIMRRKVEERGGSLSTGVAEAMARFPFKNVRELQGALNRLLAVQELEERLVELQELPAIMGDLPGQQVDRDEFARLLDGLGDGEGSEGEETVEEEPSPPEEPRWLVELRTAAEEAEAEDFDPRRLQRLLESEEEPEGWEEVLVDYRTAITRSKEIREELDELGNPWPEAATSLLRDPDRLDEAETLLASARERARPFPHFPDGPTLEEVKTDYPPLAIRASERLLIADRPDYNPLFLHCAEPGRALPLLEAVGRSFQTHRPEGRVGLISVSEFAEEFIRAISGGVAGAWRERWWTLELLLLHGVDQLSSTERAQEEFFHLFEALKRRGARIVLAADRPPGRIEGVDERLLSRFEGGLVVDLGDGREEVMPEEPAAEAAAPEETAPATIEAPAPAPAAPEMPSIADTASAPEPPPPTEDPSSTPEDDLAAVLDFAGLSRGRSSDDGPGTGEDSRVDGPQPSSSGGGWTPSPERVVWDWPELEERIVDEE